MITKWTKKNNMMWTVANVSKGKVNNNIVTRFTIIDKIKGLEDENYVYGVTVFQNLIIEKGDAVKLLDIDHIVVSYDEKTKKIKHFISAIVEVVKGKEKKERVSESYNNPYAEQ